MKNIDVPINDLLGTDFWGFCRCYNVLFSFDGYSTVTVTINEEFEEEILRRIAKKDWE